MKLLMIVVFQNYAINNINLKLNLVPRPWERGCLKLDAVNYSCVVEQDRSTAPNYAKLCYGYAFFFLNYAHNHNSTRVSKLDEKKS